MQENSTNFNDTTDALQLSDYDDPQEISSSKQRSALKQRQESDNEKIVSAYFQNRPPPKRRDPIFPNVGKFAEAISNSDRMSPMIQSLMQIIAPTTTKQSSPLMNLMKFIRVPNTSGGSGPDHAAMQQQMTRLRETLNQRNISGILDKTLEIAANPVSIGSLISGVVQLVRCNTVERLNNEGNCS